VERGSDQKSEFRTDLDVEFYRYVTTGKKAVQTTMKSRQLITPADNS